MDKFRMHSRDLTQRNVDAIAVLFPTVVTETLDAEGAPARAVDFDALRQELSDFVVEGPQERYQLDWPGKRAAAFAANTPTAKTLRPIRAESVDFDTTENLFIEGDNLDALKLLQESYLGKVKLIYIDPPYNTGGDKFAYPDDFAEGAREHRIRSREVNDDGERLRSNFETNGRFHSDWLSMMYPRLKLARNLLRDDGIMFASIDYNEGFNLRSIMDEIFGSDNFVGEIYWESKTKSQNTATSFDKLQPKAELILAYTRRDMRRFNLVKHGERSYAGKDAQGQFRIAEVEQMARDGVRGRTTMVFSILGVEPAPGNQWKVGQDTIEEWASRGDLLLVNGRPARKMRPDDERGDVTKPFWGFFSKDIGTAESAKRDLKNLMGEHGFDTVKPVRLIQQLIYHATSDDDIILDFFAGSGTTGHAALEQNAADGLKRTWILVQYPEAVEKGSVAERAGFGTVAQLARTRLGRAAEQLGAELGLVNPRPDLGFRTLRVDTTNMIDVGATADELGQGELGGMIDSVKPDRTDEDLLFQVMLEWGLDLAESITVDEIGGRRLLSVANDALIACFADDVTDDVVQGIAKRQPLRAVFLDAGFATDAARINAEQIFREVSPATDLKAV
nr:site-specific DNA-methyltransferase [uncultured Pseudokineococcus sp.]